MAKANHSSRNGTNENFLSASMGNRVELVHCSMSEVRIDILKNTNSIWSMIKHHKRTDLTDEQRSHGEPFSYGTLVN